MRVIYHLFLLLLISLSLSAADKIEDSTVNSLPLADTEVASSSVVGGCINVLTGTFVAPQNDWTTISAEPLSLLRIYTRDLYFPSGFHSCWRHNFHSQAYASYKNGNDKGGHPTCIWKSSFNSPSGNTSIFDLTTNEEKIPKKVAILYSKKDFNYAGLTNIGSDFISGQTNIKNTFFEFEHANDKATISTGSGHKYLLAVHDKSKHKPGRGMPNEEFTYIISKERKPNGNILHYQHDGDANLLKVESTNEAGNIVFGSFQFQNVSIKELKKDPTLKITGHDGREILYTFSKKDLKHVAMEKQFFVSSVTAPESPTVNYKYVKSADESFCLLSKISHPEGRFLEIDYYTEGEEWLLNRAKTLKAPVGIEGSKETIYTFSYHVPNRHEIYTEVLDAYYHKTHYYYSHEPRLKSILRYAGVGHYSLYSKEEYNWNTEVNAVNRGNLLSHTTQDAAQNILRCHSYKYDDRGNAIEEQVWGNLTGRQNPAIILKESYPIDNGVECYKVVREYSTDGFNLLLKEYEPNGKLTEYQYKPNTNLLIAKYISGPGVRIREFSTYDENALLVQKIQDNGTAAGSYDLSGVTQRLVNYITPNLSGGGIGLPQEIKECCLDLSSGSEVLLRRTVIAYDAYGHMIQKDIFDSNNQQQLVTYWTYDGQGHIIRQWNNAGQTIEYGYDANSNRIYTKGPNPNVEIHDTYDKANRCVQSEERHTDGRRFVKQSRYDLVGKLVSSIDTYGNETRFAYDEFGRMIRTEYPTVLDENGSPCVPTEIFGYDVLGNQTSHTDARGYTTTSSYTIRGKPIVIHHPDGTVESFEYDLSGFLVKSVAANGTVTLYKRDILDRVLEEKVYSSIGELLSTKSCIYDSFHLLSCTDPVGNITQHRYDGAGRLIEMKLENQITLFSYDSLGRLATKSQQIDQDARVQAFKYDLLNHVVEERSEDKAGNVFTRVQYAYDLFGNRTHILQETDVGLNITETLYNSSNQAVKIIDALKNVTYFVYNHHYPYGNQHVLQTITTDAMGNITEVVYDPLGRIFSTIRKNSLGVITAHQELFYDASGNCTTERDFVIVNGETIRKIDTLWEYNSVNQLTMQTEAANTPIQKIHRYSYNGFGQKESQTKPDGIKIHYEYNPLGLLKVFKASDHSFEYHYTYDSNQRPIQITDKDQNSTFREYDAVGNMTKEVLGNGQTLNYSFDDISRPTQVILSDESSIEYLYDPLFLRTIKRSVGLKTTYTHHYTTFDNTGALTAAASAVGQFTYEYDLLQRPKKITAPSWEENITQYDPMSNLCQYNSKDPLGTISHDFTYDNLYQLMSETGEVPHSYAHDSLCNRVSKDSQQYVLNALNQIVQQTNCHYSYDMNGNLIKKIEGPRITEYKYDALDRLITVTQGKQITTYSYDAFNRRLSKNHEGKIQHFLYQGQNEIGSLVDGKIIELRILGIGKGAEIGASVAIELQNEIYHPVHDHNGNVTVLLDSLGNPFETYRYTAFGEVTIYNNAGDQIENSKNPWRFSSKRYDDETGFIYFGRRYYSAEIGRWVTPDPLGFDEGPNLYAYVLNNPLTHVDLYGLAVYCGSQQFRERQLDLSSSNYRGFDSNVGSDRSGYSASRLRTRDRSEGFLQSSFNNLSRQANSFANSYRSGYNKGLQFGSVNDAHWDSFDRRSRNPLLYSVGEAHGAIFGKIEQAHARATENRVGYLTGELPLPSSGALARTFGNLKFLRLKELLSTKPPLRKHFLPDFAAKGEHTVFRRDLGTGKVTHYETYRYQTNPRDPKIWESVKRYDGKGAYHHNKVLDMRIDTPHVHDSLTPGGIRPAELWEITKI